MENKYRRIKDGKTLFVTTHGQHGTPIYHIWANMISRCKHGGRRDSRWYHDAGVTVCERWKDFANFYADMGDMPSDEHSLDRTDHLGNYEPSNCTWILRKHQQRNMRSNRMLTAFGETLSMAEWAERTGLNYNTLRSRIYLLNMEPETALTYKKYQRRGRK